jgi:hypothetical protein
VLGTIAFPSIGLIVLNIVIVCRRAEPNAQIRGEPGPPLLVMQPERVDVEM